MKIVNFHTYYDPTGRQLTELRLHMYKDVVDEFIICETNVTHSGLPARQGLDSLLQEVNLPGVKVRKIALEIPDVPELDKLIVRSDYINSYEGNAANINSVRGRTRERMQRDSLYSVLDEYDEDTFFIINDQDEFIDPRWIQWAVDTVEQYPQCIVKIPLVHLEGRADLRVYCRGEPEVPKEWDCAMFIVKKQHLRQASVLAFRSNVHGLFPTVNLSLDGKRFDDMGWHFSWMGKAQERLAKVEGFCHYQDRFDWLETGSYDSPETKTLLSQMYLADGMIPPSCNKFEVLRDYPQGKLPQAIFELPRVMAYLLPQSQPEGV